MNETSDAGLLGLCQLPHCPPETRMNAHTRNSFCLDEVYFDLPGRRSNQGAVSCALMACNKLNAATLPGDGTAKARDYAGRPARRFRNAGNGLYYVHLFFSSRHRVGQSVPRL